MHPKSAAVLLIAALFSQTALSQGLFTCHSREEWGYAPKCCMNIDGQVGLNCVTAHQMGATDPIWECNLFVYNITGCCQTIGYKNPYTNNTIDLCAMSTDPV
ncbi:uncharacterized protein GGS25DRAFT_474311 [Hypoxylon fragiforme]|uniref:uncharacterized protein n=1 Tax=Hypoxylon fragiforme TaxID=63214 RepID=UPI0020C5ED75|nr:uncharacterized protein GGS25DRAFT_474311 [Hypoxylon fragiforme]KAI2612211.1 hypothetical protein GGS25DRAFT_474311 [Hypoxylon fragiforme]